MQLRGVAERFVCGKHVGPAFKFSRTGGGGIGFGHEAAVSLNRWCTFRYVPGRSPEEYRILAFWGNPGTNTRADGVAFLFRHTEKQPRLPGYSCQDFPRMLGYGVAFLFRHTENVITY